MRRSIARLAAMLVLLATSTACGVRVGYSGIGPIAGTEWSALIVQPADAFFTVAPTQPIIIIIEFVPVNGFFVAPPVFFNNFIVVNPNLTSFCANILTVGNPALGTPGIVPPVIQFPIFPIRSGTCQIPLNLGMNGITTLNVQVTGQAGSSSSRRYIVRVTRVHTSFQ